MKDLISLLVYPLSIFILSVLFAPRCPGILKPVTFNYRLDNIVRKMKQDFEHLQEIYGQTFMIWPLSLITTPPWSGGKIIAKDDHRTSSTLTAVMGLHINFKFSLWFRSILILNLRSILRTP